MEWWYLGPVVLAIIMFLLVGTIFEDKIETAWQQFMEYRRVQLAEMVAQEQLLMSEHERQATCPPTCPTPVLNTCAEPVPVPPAEILTTLTEVPASNVCGVSEHTATTATHQVNTAPSHMLMFF